MFVYLHSWRVSCVKGVILVLVVVKLHKFSLDAVYTIRVLKSGSSLKKTCV